MDTAMQSPEVRDLATTPITSAGFAPFGRLIEPSTDGAPAIALDRALDLAQGTPRFYIMDLAHRGIEFARITRHRAVTQVLASANAQPWLLGVAPPRGLDDPAAEPALDEIAGFLIPGGVAVMLRRGTWHAGPYFTELKMSFFNLELTDTNEADHQSCDLPTRYGVKLRFAT